VTVQEFLEDVYEASGNEKDLCPGTYPYTPGVSTFDLTTAGSQRMLRWLNRGYRLISKIKTPDGRPVRFQAVEAELYFSTVTVEGSIAAATSTTATLDAGGTEDSFNGWLLSIESGTGEGQTRLVVDYDGSVATVHDEWTTTPSGATYKLFKRFMRLADPSDPDVGYHIRMPAPGAVANVLKITDIANGVDLSNGGRAESFPSSIVMAGRPTAFVRYGPYVYFDFAPTETIWYRMEYEKELEALTQATDEPKLPEQWQEVLWLWMVWKARTWAFEPDAAYGAKRDFYDFLRTVQLPNEMEWERSEGHVWPDLG